MLRSKIHQRFYSMIAILAIVLNTLMPLFAQALELENAARSAPSITALSDEGGAAIGTWQKLCSATGTTWIKLSAQGEVIAQTKIPPADASNDVPSKEHFSYCLYCLQQIDSSALLVHHGLLGFTAQLSSLPVLETTSFFYARIVWMTPAVRAPPRSSILSS